MKSFFLLSSFSIYVPYTNKPNVVAGNSTKVHNVLKNDTSYTTTNDINIDSTPVINAIAMNAAKAFSIGLSKTPCVSLIENPFIAKKIYDSYVCGISTVPLVIIFILV